MRLDKILQMLSAMQVTDACMCVCMHVHSGICVWMPRKGACERRTDLGPNQTYIYTNIHIYKHTYDTHQKVFLPQGCGNQTDIHIYIDTRIGTYTPFFFSS
jgi:hypothetical protein